jgi:PBS lyase HEAT-like repeat
MMSGDAEDKGAGQSTPQDGLHETDTEQIERLVKSLSSLRGLEKTVIQLIALGDVAVPALQRFLLRREPSGIYEPRCWAVRALARIGAHNVLIEFLKVDHEVSDPVEQLGEEAVMNTAARSLASLASEEAFGVLLKVAQRRPLAGAIEVLGEFRREEVVPILIRALEDDVARVHAEDALRKFGGSARSALCCAALRKEPPENESPSSARRRRSALRLLVEIGLVESCWSQLRDLIDDRDDTIAAISCMIAMDFGSEAERQQAVRTLIRLLGAADFVLGPEIEQALASHFEISRTAISEALAQPPPTISARATRALTRLLARLDAQHHA